MFSNRFVWLVLFCAILATSAIAQAQHAGSDQASVLGEWKITFAVSGQSASGTMSFRTEAGELVGTLATAHTGPGSLRDLKYSDGKLTATCVFERHDSILLSGEFKNGELAGKFQTEGREGTWQAIRGTASSASANHP